jgi:hypothetical protein
VRGDRLAQEIATTGKPVELLNASVFSKGIQVSRI